MNKFMFAKSFPACITLWIIVSVARGHYCRRNRVLPWRATTWATCNGYQPEQLPTPIKPIRLCTIGDLSPSSFCRIGISTRYVPVTCLHHSRQGN
jgi:hypothetical protein